MANRDDRRRRVVRALCVVFSLGAPAVPATAGGFGSGAGSGSGPEAIPWRTDLRLARAEARALGRPLWVQFTGSWCPNCVRLEQESFVQPRIVDTARDRFIPVRILLDDHEGMADRFGLGGIPATIVLSPSGDVVARREGYLKPAAFHAFLEDALVRAGGPPPAADEVAAALAGFCPVSLVDEHRLVNGDRALSLMYDGRLYRFASDRARQAFRRQPGRYLPANGGRCPVAQADRGEARAGEARWSILYRDRLFLCADEAGRERFRRDPGRYDRVAPTEPSPASSSSPAAECRRTHPLDPVPLDAGRPAVDAYRR